MLDEFIEGIRVDENKCMLDKNIILKFEIRFLWYFWEGSNFLIVYKVDLLMFLIVGNKNLKNKILIIVDYLIDLVNKFKSKKFLFKRKLKEEKVIYKRFCGI